MSDTPITSTPATNVTSISNSEAPASEKTAKPSESLDATKVTEIAKQPVFDPKTYKEKVKINGKEIEVSLEDLKRDYQIKAVSDDKMRTATDLERKAQALMQELQDNPEAALEKLGPKAREAAERIIARQLEREMETPEQTELRELREWKAQSEAQKEQDKKTLEETQHQEAKEKYAQSYTSQISEALDSGQIPFTASSVRRMAYYMQQALERGQEKTAMEVLPLVKADYMQEIKELTKGFSAAQIEESFGAEISETLRKASLEKVKTNLDNLKKPDKQAVKDEERSQRKRISLSQWGRS